MIQGWIKSFDHPKLQKNKEESDSFQLQVKFTGSGVFCLFRLQTSLIFYLITTQLGSAAAVAVVGRPR